MGAYGQRISMATRSWISDEVDRLLVEEARARCYPPRAYITPHAMFVEETSAMYAYYLADDGAVYVVDMDSSRGPVVETSTSTIRRVYDRAATDHPALAPLRDVEIVARLDAEVGLLESLRAIERFDHEPVEAAIVRHAAYFASRIEDTSGLAYVVHRLPTQTFAELHLVGDAPELVLELHVWQPAGTRVEILARGDRTAIARFLRTLAIGVLVNELVLA